MDSSDSESEYSQSEHSDSEQSQSESSQSENSQDEHSRISINSARTNDSKNASGRDRSNHSKMDSTADESLIVVRKKKAKRPVLASDSDSDSGSDSRSKHDSKQKPEDSDEANGSRSNNESDDEDNADERDEMEVGELSETAAQDQSIASNLSIHKTRDRKKKAKRPILDSDSDSELDSESKHESKEQPDDSDQANESRSHNESDEEDNADESDKMDVGDLSGNAAQNETIASIRSNHKSHDNSKNVSNPSDARKSLYRTLMSEDSFSPQSTSHDTSDIIPATDDEDEDENERSQIHCFSPRTRRSITGRRSMKLPAVDSDDDDLIFSNDPNSDDQSSHSSEYKSAAEMSKAFDLSSEDKQTALETMKRNRSGIANDSAIIKTPNPKRFSEGGANKSRSILTSTPSRSTPDIEFSDRSDESKTSGIHVQSIQSSDSESMKSILRDDSVVLLNSSEEENHEPQANSTAFGAKSSTPGNVKLVQPKLQFGRPPFGAKKTFVSRDYYNKEAESVAQSKQELKDNEELLQKLGDTLPDRGANLKRRIAALRKQLQEKEDVLCSYAIEEDHMDDVEFVGATNQPKSDQKNWVAELETIQPIHTGKQGMATFNTQKALTLNRIEKLHRAMEKCPTETDFARQPDHLNIELMPHQLHAIKWMRWRENQRPKGGLLADDMGLGKTLTVIGLVLVAKYGKNVSLAEEEEEHTESDDTDDEVDRGYKKSYKNEGGTLIVCPASLINQWEHEVSNRVKRGRLTVLMHHGNKRNESVHSLCKYDLVITTYGVISSDHKNMAALFRIRWTRIVLDEAHMIRNHSTAVSKGCCALRGNMRWGLTGTPIQNKHMDVYSMLKFLHVTPFDDLPTFKKWINPNSEAGLSRLHNILKPLLLRRTKAELQTKGELQELPSKTMVIEDIELSPEEASVYTKILAYSQTLFAQYMEQHQQRNGAGKFVLGADVTKRLEQVKRFGRGQEVKSSQILILLLRLRQICDHPGLIHQMLQDECDMSDYEDEECDTVDMNIVKQMIGLKINEGDSERERQRDQDSSSEDEKRSVNILSSSNKIYDFKNPSSKCKRVIEIVKRILRETNDKIVVVSQWTSFLGIVADFLNRERVHYVELTGKTPIKDRNNIVVSFNNPSSPERVMMLSLVAGGVGLNLTGANNLILLDPHWNPQLESQAFDRVYRVGQKKDVNIYKLLCEKTVEKKIQTIQDSKLQLSDNVLTGSKQNSGSKLSIQDMRKLFDM